jgi:hypothetical protein
MRIKKMPRLLGWASLCLMLALCCAPVRAQRRGGKRPPAPVKKPIELIARVEPDTSLEEGGFKANFPDVPRRSVSRNETGLGSPDIIEYTLDWGEVQYLVDFQDYQVSITDPSQLKASYDKQSQFMRNNPVFKIVRERDVTLDGRPGREVVVELEGNIFWMRRFIFNQRNYKVEFVVAKDGKDTASIVNKWEKKATEFLDSFKVVKLPPPPATPLTLDVKSLPANFWGKVNDSTYTNEFFGFSLSIPPSWHVMRETDGELVISGRSETSRKPVESGVDSVVTIFGLTRLPFGEVNNASFLFLAEKLPSASITADEYARAGHHLASVTMPDVILHEIHPIKLGGTDFATFTVEMKRSELLIKQKVYMTTRKGFGLSLIIGYADEKELPTLNGIIESLKFQ